ncbi:hypothetical protein RYH80_10120 [Halobaculum sp. MBLA0147]|uniref:hypothetical protein n=1 Tax=Halobaculum sp. MBLA0147 TaxID=3079934 RepID=UPI003523D2BB
MPTNTGRADEAVDDEEPPAAADAPTVRACEAQPDRTVLLEDDNSDGWIASDLTVTADEFR